MDPRDQPQVWDEQYNRKAADLLQVQAKIFREIAERSRLRLSVGEQQQLSKRGRKQAEVAALKALALDETLADTHIAPTELAILYAAVGEQKQASTSLEKACDAQSSVAVS